MAGLFDRQAMINAYKGVKDVEIFEAAELLKVELSRHIPEAARPSEKKQASMLAGESLREYFSLVVDTNLTIPWDYEELELYSEGDIDAGQIGYRWYAKDGGPGDPVRTWPANWLVLGQRSGDPVILDQETGSVMMAYHGTGKWTPVIVASSVADFVGILAVWVRVGIGEFQYRFTDESHPVSELKERLEENLRFLPQAFRDNFLNFLYD